MHGVLHYTVECYGENWQNANLLPVLAMPVNVSIQSHTVTVQGDVMQCHMLHHAIHAHVLCVCRINFLVVH